MRLTPVIALGVAFALGCGLGDITLPTPPDAAPPAVGAPPPWSFVEENGQTLVRAGATSGLALGQELVLLGPALAGTENRQIVGVAAVSEIWPDLTRVELTQVRKGGPAPEQARPKEDADQSGIDAMNAAGATQAPRKGPGPAASPDAVVVEAPADDSSIPADLRTGTVDSRIEALERHEKDAAMTGAIVWVMKNDTSEDVRFKAWRVVRARWNRGTGSGSAHEAATSWAAVSGPERMRIEALELLGEKGSALGPVAKGLGAGSPSVRVAAAEAMRDIAARTGKKSEAKQALEHRKEQESDSGVRRKLEAIIDDL